MYNGELSSQTRGGKTDEGIIGAEVRQSGRRVLQKCGLMHMTGKAQLCRTKKIVASKLQKVLSETFLWKLNDLTMKYFNLRIIRLRCDQD